MSYPGQYGGGYPPQGYPPQPNRGYPGTQTYPPQQYPNQYPPQQQPQTYTAPGYQPARAAAPPPSFGAPLQAAQPPAAAQQDSWAKQLAAALSPNEVAQIRVWFDQVDTDHSQRISAQELSSLNFGGKAMGLEVAKRLIRIFDTDRNGEIDFGEYCSLHSFLGKVYNSFIAADVDKSLKLDPPEIIGAMKYLGFNSISQTTVEEMVRKFDPTKQGISIDRYLYICAHLATVRTIFEWNDRDRDGQITLNLDQLSHITIHLLDTSSH